MKSSIILAGALLLANGAASAHVVVGPRESAPGETVTYSVLVPSHLEATTIALELEIPAGVEIVSIGETPGGHKVSKTPAGETSVRWTTKIPKDERATLTFVAKNPAAEGELAWKAHQVYDNGVTIDWVEPKGGKETASITKVVAPAK
ncbi:MAG: DUF1775 domain-containing protein [Rhodospirillaceae bacterium]